LVLTRCWSCRCHVTGRKEPELRNHGSVDLDPGLVLIGTVQFTATDGMEDQQREEEKALDLLASHSPQAARHPVLGFVT
jgi:hypothetical protein